MESANSFYSRVFSSSSDRSRRASDIHRRVKPLCTATLGQIDTSRGEYLKRLPDGANFAPFVELIHERASKLAETA